MCLRKRPVLVLNSYMDPPPPPSFQNPVSAPGGGGAVCMPRHDERCMEKHDKGEGGAKIRHDVIYGRPIDGIIL